MISLRLLVPRPRSALLPSGNQLSDGIFGARDHRAGDPCYEKLGFGGHFVPVLGMSYSGVRAA
jgi:hypothetical protein